MSKNIWFVSDTHFGHENFLKFLDENEKLIRPFENVTVMDEYMIHQWNSVVRSGDRVYHLGDVAFNAKTLPEIMARLPGSKRLMLGNHDEPKEYKLDKYFKKIRLWRNFKAENFVCSHIPLREDQMRKVKFNVHGHIHEKKSPSLWHINVCVETNDYKPYHMDEILGIINKRLAENPGMQAEMETRVGDPKK